MEEFQFAHFSDIHFIAKNSSEFVKSLPQIAHNPRDVLEEALLQAAKEPLQFVLLTGDIVHEGEVEEYRAVKNLFQRFLPGIPIFAAAGNHDRRKAMCLGLEGWLPKEDAPYIRSSRVGGLRVVALDSAYTCSIDGELTEEQLIVLHDILREPAPCGTLLILHHPLCAQKQRLAMKMPDALKACLELSEIKGIFTGHLHHAETGELMGIPHFISNSLSFGIETEETQLRYTDHCAWQLCGFSEEDGFSGKIKEVVKESKTLKTKPYPVD